MNRTKFSFSRSTAINLVFFFVIFILAIVLVSRDRGRLDNEGIGTAGERAQILTQKAYWTCAMHPKIHKDSPGQCPICGMKLIKMEEAAREDGRTPLGNSMPSEHTSFSLSSARQQMIGIKVGVSERKPLFKDIRLAGRVAFDPELYTAQNEYAETLRQSQRVKDSPIAEVRHSAQQMVQSAKLRLKILGLSDKQIARIGTQEGTDSSLLISKPGQDIWIYAEVYEMDLPYIRTDQSAEITTGVLGGKPLKGKVVSVDRVINAATRTAKARILILEKNFFLRPESYVDVTIHVPLGEQVTVPFDAVLDTGKQSWVFVINDKNEFVPRLVTIGLYAGDEVAITAGLSGGEKIVTSANFLIDSESRLKNAALPQKTEGGQKAKPACPERQHWDLPMAMCMPD
ncbi:MAG: efflux RND transporter periplasmic adaptor subunit [Bdellovibrionia bacterium]